MSLYGTRIVYWDVFLTKARSLNKSELHLFDIVIRLQFKVVSESMSHLCSNHCRWRCCDVPNWKKKLGERLLVCDAVSSQYAASAEVTFGESSMYDGHFCHVFSSHAHIEGTFGPIELPTGTAVLFLPSRKWIICKNIMVYGWKRFCSMLHNCLSHTSSYAI